MRARWSRTSRLYLVASIALASVAGLLVRGYVARAAATAAAGQDGSPETVVAASHPVARGTALRAADLQLIAMPARYVPPGSLRQISGAAGRVVLADLAPGEVVTQTRLARVRAGPVASLIPRGLRAFAVPTSLPLGAVVAGDHVDVLATFSSGQVHTEIVVSSVQVLFVVESGQGAPGSSGANEGGSAPSGTGLDAAGSGAVAPTTLILLVSEDQEQRLAFARAFADLAIAVAPAEEPGDAG